MIARDGYYVKIPFVWELDCGLPNQTARRRFRTADPDWLVGALSSGPAVSPDPSVQLTMAEYGPHEAASRLLGLTTMIVASLLIDQSLSSRLFFKEKSARIRAERAEKTANDKTARYSQLLSVSDINMAKQVLDEANIRPMMELVWHRPRYMR
jgi:hypothetical protein